MGTEYSNPIYRTINEKKSEYDKERNNKVYSGFMNKNMDKYLQGGVYGVKVFIKDTYKDNKDIGLYYTIDGSDPKIGNDNTAEISRIVRNDEKDYEIINYEYNDQEKFWYVPSLLDKPVRRVFLCDIVMNSKKNA